MAGSVWSIIFHPWRSRDEIESLRAELADCRERLEKAEQESAGLNEKLKYKIEVSETIIRNGDEEREKLKNKIAELEEDKTALNAEISEWKQLRIELDAVSEQLKEFEKVKADYEDRIKKLTLSLRDAYGRRADFGKINAGELDTDLLEPGDSLFLRDADPIDMLEATIPTPAQKAASSSTQSNKKANAGRAPKSSATGSPRSNRLPKDDSDWLLTLPPE